MRFTKVALLAWWPSIALGSTLTGIPTVPFDSSSDDTYSLANVRCVVVDEAYADAVDQEGETLIPPTLYEFASTFVQDLHSVFGVQADVVRGSAGESNAVFITLGNSSDYLDAAGAETSEGYSLSVTSSGIVVTGASPLGAWWGTRTILQQAILSKGSIAVGSGKDSPGWGVRGMMLDAARHYYPPEFIKELCSYMSFFKQNTFHLHLSDNLYNNVQIYSRERSLDLYARFRLWSDAEEVAGLNKHKNESYTREQFDDMQTTCAARGVTIIPEIEVPGHSLVIVQWKPELGLEGQLDLLNISHPDTIPTVKTIFSTFIDWFHTKTVHIGADEYLGPAEDYNLLVNTLSGYINEISNKSIRIWGTFPPKPTYDNIHKNVTIQHWDYSQDNPYTDYVLNNYTVINSDDKFYVVNKWSGSFPPTLPYSRTFTGNPENNSLWYPYIFDMNNSTDNPTRDSPFVIGEIAALWNDYGANTSVYSEVYYAWKYGIPAIADKQWGGDLNEIEFEAAFAALESFVPGQNLDRTIASKTSLIFDYKLNETQSATSIVDSSGNNYHANTSCSFNADNTLAITPTCSLKTPLSSKGRDYTLSLSLRVKELANGTDATLLTGHDSTLLLTPNITFFAGGNYYSLNSTLPLGSWTDLSIIARGNQTFATINGGAEQEFLAKLGINGERFVWTNIAFEAPLAELGGQGGGWTGDVSAFSLTSEA